VAAKIRDWENKKYSWGKKAGGQQRTLSLWPRDCFRPSWPESKKDEETEQGSRKME